MIGSLVSPQLRARVRGAALPIALAFGRVGLTPNSLTVLGFGISVLAALAVTLNAWIVAGLLVIFGGVFDLFDGALARATNRVSRLGAFLDSVFDRSGEAVIYLGIIVVSMNGGFSRGVILAGAAMAASFLVSYTRAKSESLGFTPGTGMANIGVAPREVRLVLLTIGLLLTGALGGIVVPLTAVDFYGSIDGNDWAGRPALAASLGLIAVLATITTIQRIVHVARQAPPEDRAAPPSTTPSTATQTATPRGDEHP